MPPPYEWFRKSVIFAEAGWQYVFRGRQIITVPCFVERQRNGRGKNKTKTCESFVGIIEYTCYSYCSIVCFLEIEIDVCSPQESDAPDWGVPGGIESFWSLALQVEWVHRAVCDGQCATIFVACMFLRDYGILALGPLSDILARADA